MTAAAIWSKPRRRSAPPQDAALEVTTERSIGEPTRGAVAPMRERMHRGYANLREALTDAERGATAARPLAGRLLTAARR